MGLTKELRELAEKWERWGRKDELNAILDKYDKPKDLGKIPSRTKPTDRIASTEVATPIFADQNKLKIYDWVGEHIVEYIEGDEITNDHAKLHPPCEFGRTRHSGTLVYVDHSEDAPFVVIGKEGNVCRWVDCRIKKTDLPAENER